MTDNYSQMRSEPASEGQSEKAQHHLLIESVFRRARRTRLSRWLPLGAHAHPIRGIPFDTGLRLTNIDKRPFPGALIHSFEIKSNESDARFETDTALGAKALNPGESETYWFEKQVRLTFEGPVTVSCHLQPNDEATEIKTYHGSTHKPAKCSEGPNYWFNGEYVEEKLAVFQAQTNQLILVLTALTFLQGVWGLDTIFRALLWAMLWLIRSLLELLLRGLPQS